MLQVKSAKLGTLEVSEQHVLEFPNGIPAFEKYKKFVLVPADTDQETPFFFLQSVDDAGLCFFVLETLRFFPQYEIKLDDSTINTLEIEQAEQVSIFTFVTVQGELKDATTNLKAPLVVNHANRKARQMFLESSEYMIKQPLFSSELSEQQVWTKG